MAEQKRLAIISAEGGVFDLVAGRYSNNVPNLDLWLKGHAGDQLRVDRKGQAPEFVKRPALTVGLMVQPSVIATIGKNPHFRGRGLLARFLYARPVSRVGQRRSDATPVPEPVRAAYTEAVTSLVLDLSGWCGGAAIVPLVTEARDDVLAILDATEAELRDGGAMSGPIREWGSKYVGAVMRLAALLHLADHGPDGVRRPIDRTTIRNAVRIGTYFKACAVATLTTMSLDSTVADAIDLLDRIVKTGEDEVSERDIRREARSGRFGDLDVMRQALTVLVEHNLLVPLPQPESEGPGRPRSRRYAVHPDAPKYGTERTEWTNTHSVRSVHSVRNPKEAK
jgi:hypothetical protein